MFFFLKKERLAELLLLFVPKWNLTRPLLASTGHHSDGMDSEHAPLNEGLPH